MKPPFRYCQKTQKTLERTTTFAITAHWFLWLVDGTWTVTELKDRVSISTNRRLFTEAQAQAQRHSHQQQVKQLVGVYACFTLKTFMKQTQMQGVPRKKNYNFSSVCVILIHICLHGTSALMWTSLKTWWNQMLSDFVHNTVVCGEYKFPVQIRAHQLRLIDPNHVRICVAARIQVLDLVPRRRTPRPNFGPCSHSKLPYLLTWPSKLPKFLSLRNFNTSKYFLVQRHRILKANM